MSDQVKLSMHTSDLSDEKFAKLLELFPNAVTETISGYDENGKAIVERAIDAEILAQEINKRVLTGKEERYQFTWPDKRKAMLLANSPISATLRPCREESVDFDITENLYIEGDNLDVLKLLRETYLNKVKMIYIDPPYNTGNDFVYKDDYSQDKDEYLSISGQFDEEGNRLVKNTESNGRFHTDWLNLMYPRLKLARDFLTEDGVIFISINDYEIENLVKLCNEIFGERNFIATLVWDKNHSAQAGIYKVYHEYVLVYCRDIDKMAMPSSLNNDHFESGAMKKASGRHPYSKFTFPKGTRFEAEDGFELKGEYGGTEKVRIISGKMMAKDRKLAQDITLEAGFTQANQMFQFFYGNRESLRDSKGQKIIDFYFNSAGKIKVVKERSVETPQTTLKFGTQGAASIDLARLFDLDETPFSAPKPVSMLTDFINRFTENDDIIFDFFSGSATIAQAVFEANLRNGQRKFILVQIPEDLDESLRSAQKDAVNTIKVAIDYLTRNNLPHIITEIGKERIRRSGKKIKEESGLMAQDLDIGFRVLKLDSSNMKDVYYTSDEYAELDFNLEGYIDNIKEDRTDEDLLFQVMLELGISLSVKIENHGRYFDVDNNYLIACFDMVDSELITELAMKKPYYVVFRDSSFLNDSALVNVEQIFSNYSPTTEKRVL